jgi:ABC-type glycerol-3-phosphate transport system substrate-binding protein
VAPSPRNGTTRIWSIAASVAAAALVGVALTACSSSASPTASGGTVALKMYNDNPQWKDGFIQAGAEIAKTTGYTLDPMSLPTTANYTQTVLSALPTNKSGDIIKCWSGKMLQGLAATGQLQDLTPQWDAAVKAGEISDALRPFYSYKGKVYAVPFVQSYWVTFYSKTAFQKAGIAAPPTTWADLEADLGKLKTAGYQFCTGQSEGWPSFVPFQMFVGAESPEVYNKLTENKAKFDDPAVKKALTTWKKWIDNGWTTAPDTKTFDCPAAMKAGKVAMVPMGTWANGMFKTAGLTDSEYGAFLTPSMNDGQKPGLYLEGGAIAVPKNAPHKDGALKAIAAWLTEPVQKVWSGFIGDASPNPKVPVTDPVITSVADQVKSEGPTVLNRYYESFPPKLVQSSISTLGGFMVDPTSLDKTMSDLTSQAQKEWAAWDKNPSIG